MISALLFLNLVNFLVDPYKFLIFGNSIERISSCYTRDHADHSIFPRLPIHLVENLPFQKLRRNNEKCGGAPSCSNNMFSFHKSLLRTKVIKSLLSVCLSLFTPKVAVLPINYSIHSSKKIFIE